MDWKWLVMVAAAFLAATTWFVRRKQSSSAPAHKFQVGGLAPRRRECLRVSSAPALTAASTTQRSAQRGTQVDA